MQILIPMTGRGSRFKAAGYEKLKPFIEVQGKAMIEWVTSMFPGDQDKITYICRDHYVDELKSIIPNAKVFTIDSKSWPKLGPVHDVLTASSIIDDEEPAIICYCDYYMLWDYQKFKDEAIKRNCDGAVPCYSGFHPNLIPEQNLYASCKVDDDENLIEIKEKFSWEKDKTKARHSPGVYYFKSGAILKKYCQQLIDAKDSLNGEYYASLPYNYLVKDGLKVWCPINVPYFCQWGTPQDLEEFNFWIDQLKGNRK